MQFYHTFKPTISKADEKCYLAKTLLVNLHLTSLNNQCYAINSSQNRFHVLIECMYMYKLLDLLDLLIRSIQLVNVYNVYSLIYIFFNLQLIIHTLYTPVDPLSSINVKFVFFLRVAPRVVNNVFYVILIALSLQGVHSPAWLTRSMAATSQPLAPAWWVG